MRHGTNISRTLGLALLLLASGVAQVQAASICNQPLDKLASPEASFTTGEISNLDVAHSRLNAFNSLTAKERSVVWGQAFSAFLTEHPDLTAEQQNILWELIELGNPELFAIQEGDSRWSRDVVEPVADLVARAQKAFPPKLLRETPIQRGVVQSWLLLSAGLQTVAGGECNCEEDRGGCCEQQSCMTQWVYVSGSWRYLDGVCIEPN